LWWVGKKPTAYLLWLAKKWLNLHQNAIESGAEAIRLNDQKLTNQDIVVTIFDDRFVDMPAEELHKSIKRQLEQIAKWS
jgi:hypothetical protein